VLSYYVLLRDDIFSSFDRTPTCDRQTDGWTDTGPSRISLTVLVYRRTVKCSLKPEKRP